MHIDRSRTNSISKDIIIHSLDELLLMQSKGKFLRPSEKKSIRNYEKETRLKRLKK
jgi:hypothetical protein